MWRSTRNAGRASVSVFLFLVAFPLPMLGVPTTCSSDSQHVTAFVNVNLVSMEHDGVVRGQTVLVHGAVISDIGPASAVAIPACAIKIDGTGLYLLPGLADMHVHLDSLVQARPNFGDAPLFLAYGITTVLNLRGEPDHLVWRKRIRDGELLAPNLYTSGEFINEPRVRTSEEAEREVVSQFHAGYDVIKYHQIVDKEGRYLTTSGLSHEAYMRMNDVARRLGIPLLGHAPINLGLNALLSKYTESSLESRLAAQDVMASAILDDAKQVQ